MLRDAIRKGRERKSGAVHVFYNAHLHHHGLLCIRERVMVRFNDRNCGHGLRHRDCRVAHAAQGVDHEHEGGDGEDGVVDDASVLDALHVQGRACLFLILNDLC
jgi:hypothetical protein